MTDLLSFFNERTDAMLELLQHLVRHESPSSNKMLVDRLGMYLHGRLEDWGARVTVYPRDEVGDIRLARWNEHGAGRPILLLTHIDTVWAEGTLDGDVPLRIENGCLYGPGALDMKGGVTCALEAIRGLRDLDQMPERPIWMLATTDEETGSFHSKALILEVAAQAGLVLVAEPAGEMENLKTARKGISRYWVRSEGRAAHSGNAPEAGINAIIDNAHQAIRLHELNDLPNGTSVSVTQISGGTAMNVIPPQAELYIDVRFLKASEAERIDAAVHSLEPVVPGAKVEVRGFIDRLPMERNEQMIAAFRQARQIGQSIGLMFGEELSGGGSDGNFTAGAGAPTLDGLGPEGKGMHALHEHVLIRTLPRRAALLAALMRDWKMPDEA
jgi:glutamate carboxypeptidase